MRRILFLKWLRDVSIARKLYFTVGIMALLIGIELVALFFSINTLSSVRAYVGGEGLYAKAQKNAIYHLYRYGVTRNEAEYKEFYNQMKVPEGDHEARMAMIKGDWAGVRKGFEKGRNHPDDVEGMIKLMRRFSEVSYISKAIGYWAQADEEIAKLIPIAEGLHTEITNANPSQEKINTLLDGITPINARLSILEDNFSFTLGEGSRWLEGLVLKLLFGIALTVEVSGLLLAILLSRDIQRGLNEIISAAASFAKGNYSTRAKVYSKDEIGVLANAFNEMSVKLEKSIIEKEESERRLQNYNHELEGKNKELEQFAYVASHDLQEPLRTVSGFVDLLNSRYKENLDKEATTYLKFITEASIRMKNLIKALLDYSRIGKNHQTETVDMNMVLEEVKDDLKALIEEKNVTIIAEKLPVVKGYPVELKLLLQNLINNAIKFQKRDSHPVITITAYKTNKGWQFSVKDNGIGIEKEHWDKIFVIFQRLHLRKEYDGTGIGLSQCSKVANLHNGKIWVESEFGKGSTFYFTINTVL